MNYFVSIGDCYHHEWQIDILLNSFKNLKLDDKLFIAVATNKKNRNYKKDNFYFFKDIGSEKEYLKYNKWYSLYLLIKSGTLKQPIVVLEPHMLLASPINYDFSSNVTYQPSNEFNYSDKYLIKNINMHNQDYIKKYWFNFGDTVIFNNLKEDFFLDILIKIESYSLYLDDYNNLDKIALSQCLWDYALNQELNIRPQIDIESTLNQNNLKSILNYRHGFKSIFNKNFYKNKKIIMSDKDLKGTIGSIRYTKCLDFFYSNIN